MCEIATVKRWPLLCRLLSVLAIVGFMLAPMASPAGAASSHVPTWHAANMTHGMGAASSDVAAVANDKPCCPDEEPCLPDCQKSCLFALLCASNPMPAAPAASLALPTRVASIDVKMPGDDLWHDRLPEPPPPKPPRA